MPAIIFICTGNICRSPMAEYLLRKRLGPDSGWDVSSAGLLANNGLPASAAAVKVLAEDEQIDLTPHRSRILTPAVVEQSDLLVCMTPAHRAAILRSCPGSEKKTFVLTDFQVDKKSTGIPDPIGCSEDVYRQTKNHIDSALSDLILYIKDLV